MSKQLKTILYFLAIVFGFSFFLLSPAEARAATVEFTGDVILDIPELGGEVFVEAFSKCASLTISGSELSVDEIPADSYFSLKTANHKVLKLTPSGGSVTLTSFDGNYYSMPYDSISQWRETSSVSVTHIVGVPKANAYYQVKVDDVEIPGSPFQSNASREISFSRKGSGKTEVYTIHPVSYYPEAGELISSTFDTEIEKGVAYNSILWEGDLPSGTEVELKLATSNIASPSTWDFYGAPHCWDANLGPGEPMEIKGTCRELFNNKRYYRYKIILTPNLAGDKTPVVKKVIINYSP